MSGLKTFVVACLFVSVMAPSARADTTDLATIMAGCIGRFSAEVEHAWLMRDAHSEVLERQRAGFLAILDALDPKATARDLLLHRIDTKVAHAKLLQMATFQGDTKLGSWAKKQSQLYKERCAGLLLDS